MNWAQENAEMRTGKRSGSFAGGGTTCDRPQRSSMVPTEAANCWEGEEGGVCGCVWVCGVGGGGEREWLTAQCTHSHISSREGSKS